MDGPGISFQMRPGCQARLAPFTHTLGTALWLPGHFSRLGRCPASTASSTIRRREGWKDSLLYFLSQRFSNLNGQKCHWDLVKMQVWFISPEVCMPNKPPGDGPAADPGPHLEEWGSEHWGFGGRVHGPNFDFQSVVWLWVHSGRYDYYLSSWFILMYFSESSILLDLHRALPPRCFAK